jgi:SRSO17 transposase
MKRAFDRRSWKGLCQGGLFILDNLDDFVKTLKMQLFVIPAKAGIQQFQKVKNTLDSGFHRSDDFFRDHQL